MTAVIHIGRSCGADGFAKDLPLDRDTAEPIVVDLPNLRDCHPMFAVRLRIFLDWHLAAGHTISVIPPTHQPAAQRLADIGVSASLAPTVISLPAPASSLTEDVLPVYRAWMMDRDDSRR